MAVTYVVCLGVFLYCLICQRVQAAFLDQEAPSSCQSLRPPVNGLIQCSQNVTHLICTATCSSGYKFDSGLKSEKRTCDDTTGSWINGNVLPLCVAQNTTTSVCPTQNINQFTKVDCLGDGDRLSCTLRCVSGYKFDSGVISVMRFCDTVTKSWVGGYVFPQCVSDNIKATCNNTLLSSVNGTQFTASSIWAGVKGYYFGPERARLDSMVSHNGTLVNSGGWRPAANTLDQYIQVELNEVTRITGIITKGRHVISGDTANEFVTKFRVLHSLDGKTWEPYSSASVSDQFLDGNTDSDTPVTNVFSCPFDALYVRVNPLVWNENIALRFELLGCPPASGPSTCSDLRTTMTTTTVPPTTTKPPSTTQPRHLCHSIPPPLHGVVNCEESGNQLGTKGKDAQTRSNQTDIRKDSVAKMLKVAKWHRVCVANCQQGYRFATNEVLVKRVCLQQSGAWPAGQGFPACVGHLPTTSPQTPIDITNKCLDVQKRCEKIDNGDYQACADCHFFATCSEGFLYVRACPEQLLYDAIEKQCDYHSRTCPGTNAQPIG